MIRIPGSCCIFFRLFFKVFLVGWFFYKTYQVLEEKCIVCCCLLPLAVFVLIRFFRASFPAKVYTPGPRGKRIISTKRLSLLSRKKVVIMLIMLMVCSYIHNILLKQGRDDGTLSSLPVHNQGTPTSKTVERSYSCVTLYYTYI